MNAFRFGEPGRECFAFHHGAQGHRPMGAVLLCNPFGQEAIRAHRLYRVLAERLARAGFEALRFDYRGTGDSDGEDDEGDLESFARDVRAADGELSRLAPGLPRAWFGLRLGASVAALAAADGAPPPARLVLWSPVVDGPRYLRELAEAHAAETKDLQGAPDPDRTPSSVTSWALGFPLPERLREQIARLDAGALAAAPSGALTVLFEAGDPQSDRLAALTSRAASLAIVPLSQITSWASDEAMSTAIAPMDGIQAALAALGAA